MISHYINVVFIAIHPATYKGGGFLAHGVLKDCLAHSFIECKLQPQKIQEISVRIASPPCIRMIFGLLVTLPYSATATI